MVAAFEGVRGRSGAARAGGEVARLGSDEDAAWKRRREGKTAAREARGRFRRLDAFRCGERDDENLKICARAAARRDGAFQTYASFD